MTLQNVYVSRMQLTTLHEEAVRCWGRQGLRAYIFKGDVRQDIRLWYARFTV